VGDAAAATSPRTAASDTVSTMAAISGSQTPGQTPGPAAAPDVTTTAGDARDPAGQRPARGQEPGQRPEPGRRSPAVSSDSRSDSRPDSQAASTPGSSPGASVDAGPAGRAAAADVVPVNAPAVAEPASALLSVDIRPWCDLTIDGVSNGRADRNRTIELAPGRHELSCSQGPGRAAWRETVVLAAGERKRLTGSVLQPVRVRIQVAAGNAVRIAGRRHANGAEAMLAPGRHNIAVLAGDREIEYDWVDIPAVQACTVRDRPALDCYQ
ncbi:MAG TPA: hypothetical protein VNM90_12960, partial [Haliangium sp.]|nr:hypothetical protein [Haliangium sp.]